TQRAATVSVPAVSRGATPQTIMRSLMLRYSEMTFEVVYYPDRRRLRVGLFERQQEGQAMSIMVPADLLARRFGLAPGSLQQASDQEQAEENVMDYVINPSLSQADRDQIHQTLSQAESSQQWPGPAERAAPAAETGAAEEGGEAPAPTAEEFGDDEWQARDGAVHLNPRFWPHGLDYFRDPILVRGPVAQVPSERVSMAPGPGTTAPVTPIYRLPRGQATALQPGMFSLIHESDTEIRCYRIMSVTASGAAVQRYRFTRTGRDQFSDQQVEGPLQWDANELGNQISFMRGEQLRMWQDPAAIVAFACAMALAIGIAGPAGSITGLGGGLGTNIGLQVLSGALSSGLGQFMYSNFQAMMAADDPAHFWQDHEYDAVRVLRESTIAAAGGGVSGGLTNANIAGVNTGIQAFLAYLFRSLASAFVSVFQDIASGIGDEVTIAGLQSRWNAAAPGSAERALIEGEMRRATRNRFSGSNIARHIMQALATTSAPD
ncbi:MAG: hypothetical protein ACK2UH_13440, partial [Candidatus Promineifilaceae bacterium]